MKKSLLATLALTSILFTGACSSQTEGTITLENGSDLFISTKDCKVTKQDIFDKIGVANTLSAVLDLVDYDVLSAKLVDDADAVNDDVTETIEQYKKIVPDFEAFLSMQGFDSEEAFVRYLELNEYRTMVVESSIEITDEEVKAAYDKKYPVKEEADSETEDEKDEDKETKENPTLEEATEELTAEIMKAKMTNEVIMTSLADARREAGFTLESGVLTDVYKTNFDPEYKANADTKVEGIAAITSTSYTAQQAYDTAIDALGLSTGVSMVDQHLLSKAYEVKDADVKEVIDGFKVQLGQQYYPYMQQQLGFTSDEQIFEHFRMLKLQEAAWEDKFPITDEQIQDLYDTYEPSISARHILVETEEEAKEIIAQLDEAEDKEETFKTLAKDKSSDGSAANGGDLGSFGKGQMVEEFEKAAYALDVDAYSAEPVESKYGYHVIYKYDEEEKKSFDEMKDQLTAQAQEENFTNERLEKILMDLRDEAEFKFEDEKLSARYEQIRSQVLEMIEEAEKEEE